MASPSLPIHETVVEMASETWKHQLNEALKKWNWEVIERLIRERQSEAFEVRLNDDGDTLLLWAFKGGKKGLPLTNSLVDKITNQDLLAETDKYGNTALHLAATVGLVEHAKKLVEKNHNLLNIRNRDGLLPIQLALGRDPANARRMTFYLLGVMKDAAGARVMQSLVKAGFYDLALKLLEYNPKLSWEEEINPLEQMASDPGGFPSALRFDVWKSLIYSSAYFYVPPDQTGNVMTESPYAEYKMLLWKVVAKVLVNEDIPELKLKHHYALQLLKSLCSKLNSSSGSSTCSKLNSSSGSSTCSNLNSSSESSTCSKLDSSSESSTCSKLDSSSESSMLRKPFLLAAQNGIEEIVKQILHDHPTAINFRDEKQRSVFHIAVMYRQENILKIAHDKNMELKGTYVQNIDKDGNNILHMVGYKPRQAGIDTDSGAVFQMQSELQWFKKVTKLVTPQGYISENNLHKKPFTLFEEEHEGMAAKEKEWMSGMATASSVAASLVATVAFGAAFQVPGGNNDNGKPNFSDRISFTVFGISDALALFSSITSVLSFLSIFTSRYGVRDHLLALPHRVIIGQISLLSSFIFLTIAFSSTLYLVFTERKVQNLITIITFFCIPVILYAKLQLPSLIAMIKSTFCPSILLPW